MASFQIKRITLPSGKVVEIVYLAPAPQTVTAGADMAEMPHVELPHVRRIELCPACGGDRVHPLGLARGLGYALAAGGAVPRLPLAHQ